MSPTIIIVLGFVGSVTVGLLVPLMYTYTAEHFSTNARATGVALTDGPGHVGGALAPVIVLSANAASGFSGAFIVTAAAGVLTGAMTLLGITATGRSLETGAAVLPYPARTHARMRPVARPMGTGPQIRFAASGTP